ncbi:LPXTG cell wall anchor domain-containing protein, partial [Streptococcus gallolyticus]
DPETGVVKEGVQVINYYYREVVPTPTPGPSKPSVPESPTPALEVPTPTGNLKSEQKLPEQKVQAIEEGKQELPKTNSASLSGAGFAGIMSILASFGLAGGKKRRNKK